LREGRRFTSGRPHHGVAHDRRQHHTGHTLEPSAAVSPRWRDRPQPEGRSTTHTVGNTTRQFTSGYLDTLDKQSWTYGRFEMRARLATQQNTSKGIWPAFWMRPTGGGVGEIDIMEAIGSGAGGTEWNRTHQTIHHDYERLQPAQSFTTAFPTGTSPSDGFHTYAVQWEPGALTWFIDGKQVWRRDRTTTTWFDEAFARPYHLRLNQQVGGTWAGTPDSATAFPADYIIDWVRVYQK